MKQKMAVLFPVICSLLLVTGMVFLLQVTSVLARPAVTQEQVISNGLAYLVSQQQGDGGILGFSDNSDPDTTSRALLAFIVAGQKVDDVRSPDGNSMLDYLASQVITFTHDTTGTIFPGRAGLLLSAASLAGGNPSNFGGMDLIAELEGSFQPDTGTYSTNAKQDFSNGQASDLSQAWAILGLSLAGKSVPEAAAQYLLDTQAEDGSWGFGDPDTTALAVTALLNSQHQNTQDQVIQNALQYFHATQLPNGGWRPSWDTDPVNADSTGWILQALTTAGEDPSGESWTREEGNPVQALIGLQKPDGSIGGTYANPYSTAEAIIGLAGVPLSGSSSPTSDHQAGLAVFSGDGTVYTACVTFTEDSLTGYELLQRSGLSLETATNPSQGTAVCKIGNVGCPPNDCFCNMPDYWSYWQYSAMGWAYSATGSEQSPVIDGNVNAWSWGSGDPPAMLTYENLCEGVAFELPAPTQTTIPPTEALQSTEVIPTAQSTGTTQPAAPAEEPQGSSTTIILFGAILLVLVVVVIFVIRSRRK